MPCLLLTRLPACLQVTGHYCSRMPQKLLLAVDRMLALQLLDAPSVAAWLFASGAIK